jgi:hypothetical protein
MPKDKSRSEGFRREAEEVRATAAKLMKQAEKIVARVADLKKQITKRQE